MTLIAVIEGEKELNSQPNSSVNSNQVGREQKVKGNHKVSILCYIYIVIAILVVLGVVLAAVFIFFKKPTLSLDLRSQPEYLEFFTKLKTRYNGTGKTFYVGQWEQDWRFYEFGNSPLTNQNVPPPSDYALNAVLSDAISKQNASDMAKTVNSDVDVYAYIEANFVVKAMNEPKFVSVANNILPLVDIDIIGYSAYDILYNVSNLPSTLDFLQSRLKRRGGYGQRRVMISEFGYPLCDINGQNCQSDQVQSDLTFGFLMNSIAWGVRGIYWWQVFNNEVDNNVQRGFWLQKPDGSFSLLHDNIVSFRKGISSFISENPSATYGDVRKQAMNLCVGFLNNTSPVPLISVPEDSIPMSTILFPKTHTVDPTAVDYKIDTEFFASGNIKSTYSVNNPKLPGITDPVILGAQVVLDMGLSGYKFNMTCQGNSSLAELMDKDPFKSVFDLPLKSFVIWANPCLQFKSNSMAG